MKPVQRYVIHCLSETLSPLTHMAGTEGNEALINREKVCVDGKIRDVPVLSGNAIRHRMIREPGAMHLVRALDLVGKLTIDQANYLFNGGSLTESSVSENLSRIAAMQELFPLIRLLGGSLRNQVVGGSLFVKRGVLICEENRAAVSAQLPDGYSLPTDRIKPAEHYISDYQYTRSDARKRQDADTLLAEVPDEEAKSNLMIYSGQAIMPGALWYHGFVLNGVSLLEVGALFHALHLWSESGSTIGGQARIGHGQVATSYWFDPATTFFGDEIHPGDAVQEYVNHVDEHKRECVDWLNEAFPERSRKKA